MFKGNFSAVTTTANTNIPINVVWNTNGNTAYDTTNNAIKFNNMGYYNVNVMLNVTGSTPTTVSTALYSDGTVIPETTATSEITTSTGVATLNITETIKVVPNVNNSFAELSLRLGSVATITNGIITVEKVR